jgi:uncharacterized membrane protein YhhN
VNSLAWIVLAFAGVVAAADWVAVWRRPALDRAETVLKPLVLVLLIVVALVLDPSDSGQRAWFVVALVLSLAGDVFLLPRVDRFVPGLVSFLVAHVAYVVGFVLEPSGETIHLWAPLLLAAGLVGVLPQILAGVARSDPALRLPVVAYIAVISAMVVAAGLSGDGVAALGALVFAASDSILALDRFDRHRRWMPLAVMVTYHSAQAMLVLSVASIPV